MVLQWLPLKSHQAVLAGCAAAAIGRSRYILISCFILMSTLDIMKVPRRESKDV